MEKETQAAASSAASGPPPEAPSASPTPPAGPKKTNPVKEKLRVAWADDRSFKQRLWLCLLPAFLLAYTLLFFGPAELYSRNIAAVNYSMGDLFLTMGITCLAAFAVAAGLLLLLRGKVLNLAVSAVFGLALCCYVQGNFLNLDLGTLDGEAIPWQEYSFHAVTNLAFWGLLLVLPLLALYFSPPVWSKAVRFVSFLLIAVQTVALVTLMVQTPQKSRDYHYVTGDTYFEVSAQENTIVFVLDKFPSTLFNQVVLDEHPELTELFQDFTYYNNYASEYVMTFPSLTTQLTGHAYDRTRSYTSYFDEAWHSETARRFYGRLHDANYTVKLYPRYSYSYNSPADLVGLADNIAEGHVEVDYPQIAKGMVSLSAYRYAPHALKASLWMDTEALGGSSNKKGSFNLFRTLQFAEKLFEKGLTTQSAHNNFTVYHTKGTHSPFELDENMQENPAATREQQTQGILRVVGTYLDDLRELGLYDNANIVITTDHGDEESPAGLLLIKRKGESGSAMKTNAAPLYNSTDFIPTMLALCGLPYDDFGPSAFDYQEGDERQRATYIWTHNETLPEKGRYNVLRRYDIPAFADDFDLYAQPYEDLEVFDSLY